MTERRDKDYARRALINVLGFMVLTVPFMIFLSSQSYGSEHDKHLTTAGWAGLGLFFVITGVAAFLVSRRSKPYRCKLCGRSIQAIPYDESPKREHRFPCSDCDVVWTTGVYDESLSD